MNRGLNLARVWVIGRHEYLVNVRRPGFIIMTLLIPLLGVLGLGAIMLFGGQAGSFLERQFETQAQTAGVVDHYGAFTPIVPEYQDRFRSYPDDDSGRAALRAGDIELLLIIPPDYLDSARVQMVTTGKSVALTAMQDTQLRKFLVSQLLQGKIEPALRARVADPIEPVLVSLDQAQGREGPLSLVLNTMVPYFLGVLLVVTIFTSSGYLLRSVSDEKTSRVIEIVISSVTAPELLAGKVLGLGAVGLTQVVIWLLSAVALSGGAVGLLGVAIPLLARPEILVLAPIYYLLGFLVYAVLMGAAGALGTTQQESQQMAGIFSMFAAVPFMMAGFLFTNPNATVARVLSWFPLTSPTMMMLRLPMAEVPFADIAGSILLLLITIPALLWGGAKVFRMGLLMYGKRSSLKQIWQSLRQA